MSEISVAHLDELFHYGTPRESGRYPWGSGENPYQRNINFLASVSEMRKKGMSENEIAEVMGITAAKLRTAKTIARHEKRKADESKALRLSEKGLSNTAIGDRMGIGESQVRNLLNPAKQANSDILFTTAEMLRENVAEKGYLDIGTGVESHVGISATKLKAAAAILEEEGYVVTYIKVPQLGTNKETTVKVLAPPGTETRDIYKDLDEKGHVIGSITGYSEDGGRTFLGIEPPTTVDPKRVGVRYSEDGGAEMDGVIQLRRGVEDLSMGDARYAQVRIQVGPDRYLKGMAMYSDDMPDGVDMMFNTNKAHADLGDNPLAAMKKLKTTADGDIDGDNPFGSTVRQKHYVDADGKRKLSPLNIVGAEDPDGVKTPGEEGGWAQWSKNMSSQMLSKQSPSLAKEQLDLSYKIKKAEYDEIKSLTNPAVRKTLLDSFADGADSAAVHLKAAGLPRTANHVILPINSLKDDEIYAPNYRPGETVVLVRHPHGGIFEIPELKVTHKNPEANSLIRNAKDAVGINSRVAARLSGADFDGDTVLVIPNGSRKIKTSPSLEALKNFDPQTAYPAYDGMKTMDGGRWNAKERRVDFDEGKAPSDRVKGIQMGDVSNLITDMSVRGASQAELARAVKHSMVVIDAEKHSLNYRQSAKDNNIKELKAKYQNSARGGASTLISQASSEITVPDRKPRSSKNGAVRGVDPETGRKVWDYSGETYVNRSGKTITKPSKQKSTKMAETDDAFSLSSGTVMENVYATHANRLKSLANDARKSSIATKGLRYSPSAKKAYAQEVATLNSKLNIAKKNAPRERQAQLYGNAVVKAKTQANPNLTSDDLKKIRSQALQEARSRMGAEKERIKITPREWEAIQSGAITNNKLMDILANTDQDVVKQYAMPRSSFGMTPGKIAQARNMLANGYTQAEVADHLGVSTSTLSKSIK